MEGELDRKLKISAMADRSHVWDHPLGALAAYKRIITIAGCANIVSGFVTSF